MLGKKGFYTKTLNTIREPEGPEGRFLTLTVERGRDTLTLLNLNAPNQAQDTFIRQTLRGRSVAGDIIVGGDFNLVWSPELDGNTTNMQDMGAMSKQLKKELTDTSLVDALRYFHPDTEDYSLHSHVHLSYLRIDYLFTTPAFLVTIGSA
ncbi:hypothetical protein NDU88_011051 [Pleurodeles waltl]|uniref:Endonuclease/exonuclease/phosphatase domain-containing protein n=1 Tax=Pleurodeles waltl TaxID=8319 RepID=A0AAV7S542_PLEWA|nr:hypothetical protein NDU88_011051 [Pleurodeles waltl]